MASIVGIIVFDLAFLEEHDFLHNQLLFMEYGKFHVNNSRNTFVLIPADLTKV